MLTMGRTYEWKRTPGWTSMSGKNDCWVIYAKILGMNGGGGYWINEIWAWKSGGTHHIQPQSLTYEESKQLERQIGDLYLMGNGKVA